MSEQAMLTLAARYGPWMMLAISIIYIALNRMWPEWMLTRREAQKLAAETEAAEREALSKVYERFIVQNEKTIQFVSSVAEALNTHTRSLDSNTQQIWRLEQTVEHGPRCPLPDCPFIGRDKEGTTTSVAPTVGDSRIAPTG